MAPVIPVLGKDEGTQVWTERYLPANPPPRKHWHPVSLLVSDVLALGSARVQGAQLAGFLPARLSQWLTCFLPCVAPKPNHQISPPREDSVG